MKEAIFTGACTALVTPFIQGQVNYPMAELLLRRQIDAGINAVVLAGTTGESPTLTDEEKLVVEQLQQGPRLRDDVIADSTLPAARVGAILTMLEIKGILGRLPGNMLELK